ncbi:MAG: hypothetical protein WBC78_09945 [Candidatus Sulfotelmatobacter sp.]
MNVYGPALYGEYQRERLPHVFGHDDAEHRAEGKLRDVAAIKFASAGMRIGQIAFDAFVAGNAGMGKLRVIGEGR